ncbi:hypothetical protein T02_14049 [Trichinella nativa]|uniref:Uncharacterized protein n=1 Tax=Trichinella nativa TaxID=6335 RepID=A0A0V1KPC4_9BILA|nr:hypothetical protein T02_14049 [Trichinella nativa]
MPNVSSLICQHYNVHKEVAKQLSLLINQRTSHKKLAIYFSRFVKNAIRRGPDSFQKAQLLNHWLVQI